IERGVSQSLREGAVRLKVGAGRRSQIGGDRWEGVNRRLLRHLRVTNPSKIAADFEGVPAGYQRECVGKLRRRLPINEPRLRRAAKIRDAADGDRGTTPATFEPVVLL